MGLVVIVTGTAIADIYLPNLFPFLNLTGFSGTYSSTGNVDLSGPFFRVSAPMAEAAQPATSLATPSDSVPPIRNSDI